MGSGRPGLASSWPCLLGDFRRFTQLLGAGLELGSGVQGAAVLSVSCAAARIVRHTGADMGGAWAQPKLSSLCLLFLARS